MYRSLSYILLAVLLSALMPVLFSCGGGGGGPAGPSPGAPNVELDQTQCKNVGFGAQTQVHVEATDPNGKPLTFEWKFEVDSDGVGSWPGGNSGSSLSITSIEPVPPPTLTGADTPTVSFTTFTIEQTLANLNRKLRDRFEILPFSTQEVNYIVAVTVSNGKNEADADITCTSASPYGGWQDEYIPANFDIRTQTLPFRGNTDLGLPIYFNGGTNGGTLKTWNWSITSAPAGSTASIVDSSSRTPHFIPDVVGDYVVTESVSKKSFNISASEWLGATAPGPNCQVCHSKELTRSDDNRTLTPKFATWQTTGHASMFQRGIDGDLGPDYSEGCIVCHTVGYNLGNTIFNGGFHDVQKEIGWTFPDALAPENFDVMPAQLKALANIQCENCHGPGERHAKSDGKEQTTVVNYTGNECAQCHDESAIDNIIHIQWDNSPHSKFVTLKDLSSQPLGGSDPALRGFCTNCHSTGGFVQWIRKGGTGADLVTFQPPADLAEPQTCTACHDLHNEANHANLLWEFGSTVTLAGYTTPKRVGKGAQCIKCHNSRKSITDPNTTTNQSAAHASLQGDILLGENLFFAESAPGGVYPNSAHTTVTHDACLDCHMAVTPPVGDPEHNLVGEHTFLVTDPNTDFQNIGIAPTAEGPKGSGCLSSGCHAAQAEVFKFDLPHTYGDFDGNGKREGVQTEIKGLIALLQDAIGVRAMNEGFDAGCSPQGKPTAVSFHGSVRLLKSCRTLQQAEAGDDSAFTHPAGGIPDQTLYKAGFNLLAVEQDKSEGVHNVAFVVTALRTSYEQITGIPPPGEDYPHGNSIAWIGNHPGVVIGANAITTCISCHFKGNPYGAPLSALRIKVAPCNSCHGG